jgi:polyphosphate kinase 2 (PPK2 family)
MLEQVDLTRSLTKAEYKERMDALKLKLYDIGHAVYESKTPVVILFEGWGQSGRGSIIAQLTPWLDPRGFRVYPIEAPGEDDARFPWLWRFWLKTPARGEISIFHESWYRRVLIERVEQIVSKKEWMQGYQDILDFERMLADDGVTFVKFWLHISKQEQAQRQHKLLSNKLTAWRVSEDEQREHEHYDAYVEAAEEMFARSESEFAPWTIVAATDRRWTRVQVFETIIARLEPRVARHETALPRGVEQQLHAIGQQDGKELMSAERGTALAASAGQDKATTDKTVGDEKGTANA